MNDGPTVGDVYKAWPKGVLPFFIDQNMVDPVFVFKRISHVVLPLMWRFVVLRRLLSSVAITRPILAAGKGSIIASWVQSIRWTLISPPTYGVQISCDGLASPCVATKSKISPSNCCGKNVLMRRTLFSYPSMIAS